MKNTGRSKQITKKAIQSVLAELGNSPNKIAASLKAKHVRGGQDDPRDCALAVYLGRKFKGCFVTVGDKHASIVTASDDVVEYPLTKAQSAFIELFDGGKFPGLVRV